MRLADTIYTFKDKVESVENDYILAVQKKLREYEAISEDPGSLPTWISTKDKKPKVEERVLVYAIIGDSRQFYVAFYEDGDIKYSESQYAWDRCDDVCHVGDRIINGLGEEFVNWGWYLPNDEFTVMSKICNVVAWMPLETIEKDLKRSLQKMLEM